MASASLLKVDFVNQMLNRYSNFNLQTYASIMKILPLTRIMFSVATLSVAAAVPSQAQTVANALTNGDFRNEFFQHQRPRHRHWESCHGFLRTDRLPEHLFGGNK